LVGTSSLFTSSAWRRIALGVTLAAGSVAMSAACSATGDGTPSIDDGGSNGSGATGSGGTGGSINPGSGGSINPGSGGSINVPDAGNGMCIRIGLLGRRPSYGAMPGADNTDALQSWLNAHVKSGTTVTVVTTDTPITAEFLGGFEVVILQALEQQEGGPYWTFDQAELAAFETWVRAGGGVITLTGYGAQAAEVNPTNQLLAFSGMAYNTDDVMGTCPDNCCYCAGSSIPLGGWHAEHPIAANVTSVGVFHGRTVSPGDGAIVSSRGHGRVRRHEAARCRACVLLLRRVGDLLEPVVRRSGRRRVHARGVVPRHDAHLLRAHAGQGLPSAAVLVQRAQMGVRRRRLLRLHGRRADHPLSAAARLSCTPGGPGAFRKIEL
jgi:hypothetical protein